MIKKWIAAIVVSGIAIASPSQAQTARYVLSLSDVDMVGTAYIEQNLGPRVAQPDTLSIFDLRRPAPNAVGQITASNSVFSPPLVMDVTPDGKLALVVETLQPRGQEATRLDQLVPGRTLRAFDLSNPAQPRLVSEVEIGARPSAIHINPAGDLAVAVGGSPANGLMFYRIQQNRVGQMKQIPLPLPPRPELTNEMVTSVQWHPSGRYIAVHLPSRSQVALIEVVRDSQGEVTDTRLWGNVITTNKFPFIGRFTPDGKFYITTDLMWGRDTQGFFFTNQGLLTSIRLAEVGSTGERARHSVTGVTTGGLHAETIAISPNGRYLVASRMGSTWYPKNHPAYNPQAALALYEINPADGRLQLRSEHQFEAMLPQGLAFDPSGQFIYVGVSQYERDQNPLRGAIEVWRVQTGAASTLERTQRIFRAPRGVHTLSVIR
jgi:6-phosphogluconolactonase (cycloisomerase 2 family)